MRATSKYLFLLGLIASSSVVAKDNNGQYINGIYRAPSLDGMTGLLTMNLPYSMGAGLTVAGGGVFGGQLAGAYDNAVEAVGAVRIGMSDNVEIGFKARSFSVDTVGGGTETGMGDTEGMIKWKFREENENLPAMALGLGAILPTGDESKGFTEVDKLGIKFSVTAAAEREIYDDAYIGLYFEAQAVAIDMMDASSPYKDNYGVVNVGLAFPISDDNHLSFFTEFNRVVNKDVPTFTKRNYGAITPGLRFASQNFSLTVAARLIEYDDTNATAKQVVALLSLGF